MNRRKFVKTAVGGSAVAALAAPSLASAAKTTRLRFQSYWGKEAQHLYKQLSEDVKVASDGSLKIKWYPGGSIVPDAEMLTAVSADTLDMAQGFGSYWPGKVDMAMLESGVAASWTTYDEAQYLFKNTLTDLAREAYAEQGVYYLGPMLGGAYDLLTTKPIKSLDDLKTMKIRATPMVAKVLERFDVPTVFMPASELYVGLSTGTIDGCIYGGPVEYYGLKLYEVAKYYTTLDMLHPGFSDCMLVNLESWNALTPANQKILQLAVDKHCEAQHAWLMGASFDPEYSSKFEFSRLSAEDSRKLRESAQNLWEEEAKKSERTKKAVDALKQIANSRT